MRSRWRTIASAAVAAVVAGGLSGGVASASVGWKIQPTPQPAGVQSSLSGVWCSSPSACLAVGYAGQNLAEQWNGSKWAIIPTPALPAGFGGRLDSLSCWSPTGCMAVGAENSRAHPGHGPALAEQWNGTRWALVPTPATSFQSTSLAGVSCTSATACMAVGQEGSKAGSTNLAERWNGTTWSLVSTPSASVDTALTAVSCPPGGTCTAVGQYVKIVSGKERFFVLAERWNGSAWAIQSTPDPTGFFFDLEGVSCASATACTAVGSYENSGSNALLIDEQWNGSTWTLHSLPDPAGAAGLHGVSCSSASACTAVGSYAFHSTEVIKTLAEHWNGTAWAIQSTPNPSGNLPALNGVSCLSSGACVAVGDYQHSNQANQALAEGYRP